MKKNIDRLALAVLAAALLCAPTRARAAVRPNAASSPAGTVPSGVNYQGRLVDNGFPVTGLRSVTFRLYDASTAGTLLQTIGPQIVSVDQGLFATTVALSTMALAGPLQKFLEVQVGAQVLSPREPLNSVPYALVAKSLEENLAISTVTVGSQFISSGTLAVASIQALNGSSFFSIISPVHMSSSVLTLDGNNATALTAIGNVGIGTANPGSKLTVSSGTVVVDGSAATALVLDNSAGLPVLRFRETGADKGAIKSVSGALVVDGDVATSRALLLNTNSTGNVGVGAPIPGRKLDVDGDAQFGNPGTKSVFATNGALTLANAAALNMSAAALTLTGAAGFVTSGSSINAASFWGNGANLTNVPAVSVPASGVTAGTFQNAAYTYQNSVNFPGTGIWSSTGRVGVGTPNPATKLHMSSGTLTIDGNTATSIVTSGQVGIGGAPSNPLSVTGNANVTGTLSANTLQLTTPLAPVYGGTGQNFSAVAQGALIYFNGAGTMTTLPPGTANQVLQTNGAASNPSWASPAVGGATTLTSGKIWVGSAITNIATERTVSGDITLSNTGVAAVVNLPVISGANLTNLAPGAITAGTAGISITGNAATATALAAAPTGCTLPQVALGVSANGTASCAQPTNISGSAATATSATTAGTATIGSGFTSLTGAGIRALTPATVGQVYYCSDCASVPVCVSTGTAIASFALITNKTSVCQ